MKRHPLLLAIALIICVGFLGSLPVHAQTRVTNCNATTPNNALCTEWNAVTTNTLGQPITNVTYRLEHRIGATGTWNTVSATIVNPRYYSQNLSVGEHFFRVFVNCAACTAESVASNIASGLASAPPNVPNPAIITIAVVISSDSAPVYRIVSGNKRGELFGLVPVGRACEGPVLFRYRGDSYRRVSVSLAEVWGTTSTANLAAPCA